MPPLVMHVIHHLVTGGMENGVVNLVNTMSESRYRHVIICVEDYSNFRSRIQRPDVEVIALHRSRIGVWSLRREIFLLCRKLRPLIVHSRGLSGLDAVIPALLAGVRYRVHGEHGWDVGDLYGEGRKPAVLRRLHSPFISRYVTVSRDLKRYLESKVGISEERITHICNGVDTHRFFPAGPELDRTMLPVAFQGRGCVIVGTIGRIQAVKDQRLLLQAFAAALHMLPFFREKMRLAIVGDGPLLGELRQMAVTLGIADVTWLPGAIDDVPQVLRTFDLFVLPSLNEGISNTILEALSSGLPVVATEVGGNPELVEHGVTGKLVPAGEVATLASAIVEYVADEQMRRSQGVNARSSADDRFSLGVMVGQYQALYDKLSNRKDSFNVNIDSGSSR